MELYVFDSRLTEMKMVLTNNNIVEAHEVTQINTAGQLTFTTTIDSDVKEKIEPTDIVFVKVKDDRYHPYKIMQSKMPTAYTIQYTCIEYAYYLFAKDGLVHDKRPDNWTIQKTVFEVIKGTHWQVGYVDPNLPTVTSSFYWITRTECFKKIAELTGAEFEFYMTMANNQITSRTIEVYKQRGTDTHQRFVYGMNALEVIAEEDATNAVTKIYPRGSGEMYTSEGDGRRKLTISDVVWSKSNGDPTDKPKGQDYLVYGSSTYDLDNGNQPSSIVEFQDEKDENKLIWRAFDWLKQNNRPKVQFKAKVSEVGDLKLGDRVVIDREDLGIKYITRVFKLDRNLLNEKLNTLELGDVVAHTLADAISNVVNGMKDVNNRVDNVTTSLVDGQGNTVTYGVDEPTTKKKGDVWYKPSDIVEGIQQYDVYVWDGEKWVLTIGNQLQNELITKVEQAQKDTEEAQKQAQATSDKATQIEKDFTASISDIKADVQNVETSAQNAMSQAQKAIDKANFNDTAITDIKNQQSADGQRLTTVESNYNGLNQTVKDNAAKQESDRAQLSDLISDKVSNSEFDSFKIQTANQFADVVKGQESLNQRIQTAETTIESISDMTGSNTIVNTVKGQQQKIKDVEGHSMEALETAQGVQTTVENMNMNLLKDSDTMSNPAYWYRDPSVSLVDGVANINQAWNGIKYQPEPLVEYLKTNMSNSKVSYNFSVEVMRTDPNTPTDSKLYFFSKLSPDTGTVLVDDLNHLALNEWVKLNLVVHFNDIQEGTDNTTWDHRLRIECSSNISWKFKNMRLEYSDKVSAKEYSQLTQTIQGIQSTVQNNTGDISKLTQTAEGVITSVGNINNTIGAVYPNGNFEDTDFAKYYTGTGSITPNNELMISLSADKHVALLNEYIQVDNTDILRINFDAKFTGTPQPDAFALFVHQYDANKNEINNIYGNIFTADNHADTVYHLQQTRTLTKTTKYVRIEWVAWGGHGNGTLYISNITINNGKNTLSGQIGVLKDNINLKVSKNDVVNQINISTEGILIDGNKVHITGQTTIDNAVITSAMIKDINADTITTGTLNAANVNIVNLDVNRLTGNRGDFVSAGFRDACHDLELTGGGITATFRDWSKMTLNTYGLQWRDKDGDPIGSITTEDWLLKNGIADTLLIGAYGGRQISFSLAKTDDEHIVDTVYNIRRLSTSKYSDQLTIELPNPFDTQICIGSITGNHDYLRLELCKMNNAIYPYITGNSRNAGMFIGDSELYFRRTNGDGDTEVLSLGDIEYGKLKGLSNGSDNINITSVRYDNNNYFALLSPSGNTGVMWGDSRLYFVLDNIVYPLADILRGATWDI